MSVKINDSCLIHKGPVFEIHQDDITLQNNVRRKIEVIRHPGAAGIVAVTQDQEILLVKQYRYAVGEYIWEIPAGTVSGKEDFLVCAQREFEEETGYKAGQWQKLGVITPFPSHSDERIHLYFAHDLKKSSQNLDEDEVLSVHKVTRRKVFAMIAEGEIRDSKTISALFLAEQLIFAPGSPR